MQVIDAGRFTITTGIHRGSEHVFVTHRETGKQWVAKEPYDGRALEGHDFALKTLIECDVVKFLPNPTPGRDGKPVFSCDLRFWEPVTTPVAHARSEWDALVFIGD